MSKKYLLVLISVLAFGIFPMFCSGLDKWVSGGSNFTFEHELFSVSAGEGQDAVILKSNDTARAPVVLKINQSYEYQGLNYFFDSIRDVNQKYYEKNNITGTHNGAGKSYEYHITISRPQAKMTISRSISSKTLSPMDIFNYSIKITNTGDVELTGDYSEALPAYYRATTRLSYRKKGEDLREYYGFSSPGSIRWKGTLKPGEDVVLVQSLQLAGTVIGSDVIQFNKGFFTYSYLGVNQSAESDILSPEYYYPLDAKISFSAKTMKVDDEGTMTLSLADSKDSAITVNSVKVVVPDTMAVVDSGLEYTKSCGCYQWHGSLDAHGAKDLLIHFIAVKSGDVNITAEIDSSYLSFNRVSTVSKSIPSEIDLPVIGLDAPEKVDSNGDFSVGFSFDNKDSGYDFHNLRINITSGLFDDMQYIFTSIQKGAVAARSFSFKAPFVGSDMVFAVNFTYHFESSHDEVFNATAIRNIQVKKVMFDPEIGLELAGYSLNSSGDSSANSRITAMMNLSRLTNHTLDSAEIRIDFLDDVIYISPSEDELQNHYAIFPVVFYYPENISDKSADIEALIRYNKGEDTFMLEKTFPVDLRTDAEKASQDQPKTGSGLSDPSDYPQQDAGSGFRLGFDSRMMLISLFVILFVFVMVVLFLFVSKNKNKDEDKHDEYFSGIESDMVYGGNGAGSQGGSKKKVMWGRRKDKAENQAPLPSTELGPLEGYIKESRQRKVSNDKIRQNLLSQGWLEDIIEVFLK